MQMILTRKEAITLSSFCKFLSLTLTERNVRTENVIAENQLDDVSPEVLNAHLKRYIEQEFQYFTNSYLQKYLSAQLNQFIEVKGKSPRLFTCNCCGYKTLRKRGEYFICNVCYWEDDGNLNSNSTANKMTLMEAKNNFERIGVISAKFKKNVDKERMIQYDR